MQLSLDLSPFGEINDDKLFRFYKANPDLAIERDKQGRMFLNEPMDSYTEYYHSRLQKVLKRWLGRQNPTRLNLKNESFLLKDGSIRVPGLAWLSEPTTDIISQTENEFPSICPDFVIEIMTSHDTFSLCDKRMEAWVNNGVKLAWLLDPEHNTICIYRADGTHNQHTMELDVSGEDVLSGLTINLQTLFED